MTATHVQRKVNNMGSKSADITHKILSLNPGEDVLMEERSKINKVLLQVDLKVEWLLQDMGNSSKVSKAEAPRIHLPKISVPSFNKNILNWTSL